MPSFLVPRHVSAHRIAAIALYRSLLRQSRAAPLQLTQQDELQNIIRNRFKQTRHLHGYARLKIAFQAGYEAIDYLDAATAGNEESTTCLTSLLARAKPKVKAAPPLTLAQSEIIAARAKASRKQTAFKPSDAILARPQALETLSGPRHVPVLFSANSIPVLRIKKPQSEALSGFIKTRIKQRHKRWNHRHWLEEQIAFAEQEDAWDDLVAENGSVESEDAHVSWAKEFVVAKDVVRNAITREGQKNLAMAEKMQAVVDREQAAFTAERDAKKAEKTAEKLVKRNARMVEMEAQRVAGEDATSTGQ